MKERERERKKNGPERERSKWYASEPIDVSLALPQPQGMFPSVMLFEGGREGEGGEGSMSRWYAGEPVDVHCSVQHSPTFVPKHFLPLSPLPSPSYGQEFSTPLTDRGKRQPFTPTSLTPSSSAASLLMTEQCLSYSQLKDCPREREREGSKVRHSKYLPSIVKKRLKDRHCSVINSEAAEEEGVREVGVNGCLLPLSVRGVENSCP